MKKVLPIALILLILLSATCFAAYEPDPARWQWLYSNDEFGTFLDKDTIRYNDDHTTVDFWLCIVCPQENTHYLQNYKINKNDMNIFLLHEAKYNTITNNVIESHTYQLWQLHPSKIIPDTNGEYWYRTLFPN